MSSFLHPGLGFTPKLFVSISPKIWTPLDLAGGLDHFLKKNDQNITNNFVDQWNDSSGNNVHYTSAAGNRPIKVDDGVRFSFGAINLVATPFTQNLNQCSVFIVLTPDDFESSTRLVWGHRDEANQLIKLGFSSGSSRTQIRDSSGTLVQLIAAFQANQKILISIEISTDSVLRHNGSVVSTNSYDFSAGAISSSVHTLGFNPASNESFEGLVHEMVVLNSPVSQDDRQKIEGYLAHNNQIQEILPSTHPYKDIAP